MGIAASMAFAPKISVLELAASFGSVSYGRLPPERLRAVLEGDAPREGELAQVHQALSETALYKLAGLPRELGISWQQLDDRVKALFGRTIEEMSIWG